MATLQFKRIKEPFKNFNLLKITIESGAEQYALQPGEPLVASYKDGDAIRTVLVVANAQGGIEFIDNDGLEARVEAAEETIKDVTFVTEDTPSLHLGKDSAGLNTILSGDVKVSSASGNILSVNASSTGNTQGLYAKVVLKKDGNGSLVLTTSSLNGEQTQTIPLDKEVHLASNGSFYNPITKSLGLKLTDGSTVQVDLTNVVNVADVDDNIIQDKALGLYASTDLRYDAARNILYFFRSGSEPKEIKLNSTQILDDVTYDSIKEAIIIRFIMQSGEFKVLEVPVSQLIREWQPYNDMHTVQIERTENKTGGQDLLSADVKIASDPDNILTKKNYQLYVKGIASNIKYSADPSSGATVRDKIDELQSDVSKVSSAVDTFNDAIEYVEQIVSAVSGVSEAKISAIISGAGLNSDGSYKDKTDDPDSYPYLANAASLDKADGILARNLRTVSGQVDNHTTAITTNAADIQSLSAIVQNISGSAPSTAVDAISGKVENIITAVRLKPDGSYQPVGHPGHSFIESAKDVQAAEVSLDKAIQEIVDAEGLTIGTDSAHTITYETPTGVTALAAPGAIINDAREATSVIGDSLISLSGTVSGTPGAIIDLQGDIQDISDKVDALSGVSQDEIERIKTGAGLTPTGQYSANTLSTYIKTVSSLTDADNALDAAISGLSGSLGDINLDISTLRSQTNNNTTDIDDIKNAIGGTGGTSIQAQLDNKQEKFVPSQWGSVRFGITTGTSSGVSQNVISGTVALTEPVDTMHSGVSNNIRISKDATSGAELGLYSVADLQYNAASNTLTWHNSAGSSEYKLAGVTLIDDFYYDPDTHKIVIQYTTDSGKSQADIDVTQMGILDVEDTSTVDLTKDSTQTGAAAVIRADVKISTDQYNIVETKAGGIYVGGYASNIIYSRDAASQQNLFDVVSALTENVATVHSGITTISGDVRTMSGKVETHESILSGISASTEDIKKISAIAETLSATTHSIGLNDNGTKKPHTGTTFLTSTTADYNSEIETLDKLLSAATDAAGFIVTGGTIKYDKDRFSGSTILSASSSLTDAIEDLSEFTEKGFLSGCGLTSAGTINVNAFSGSSVLSGLTTGNSLTDAIVDLDEAFEACCDATMNAIGNIDEDGNWEIPSAITENLPSGLTSGISTVSDALAALAENGLSIDDFYSPEDPYDPEYNVQFKKYTDPDTGEEKIGANVEFFDCGSYYDDEPEP